VSETDGDPARDLSGIFQPGGGLEKAALFSITKAHPGQLPLRITADNNLP